MLNYVRWIFRLDFCTPRYLIHRELGLNILKIDWDIRAIRFGKKVKEKDDERLVKKCWLEKENRLHGEKKELYSLEKKKIFQ